jgi:hypothetical protein
MEFKVKSYALLSAAITAAAQKNKHIAIFIMFLSLCLFLPCYPPNGNPKRNDSRGI